MSVEEISMAQMGIAAREASLGLRQASTARKNQVLLSLADELRNKETTL